MIGEEMMRSGHWSVPLESSDWCRNDEVRPLVSSIVSPVIGEEMMRSGHWSVPLESCDWCRNDEVRSLVSSILVL